MTYSTMTDPARKGRITAGVASSAREAKERGLRTYFTGNPCPNGHNGHRSVINHTCVDCLRSKTKGLKAHRYNFCEIIRSAKKCRNRKEFRNKFPSTYYSCMKRGLAEIAMSHMPPPKTSRKWRFCSVYNLSRDYENKGEFSKLHSGAASYAIEKGFWNLITNHMRSKTSDFNVAYMWGCQTEDKFLMKFGVTSDRLGDERIDSVSRKSGIPRDFTIMVLCENALKVEKKLKAIGKNFNIPDVNGGTEFRILSRDELTMAYVEMYQSASRRKV